MLPTAWCYDDIEENLPLVTDQFNDIINSQEWDKAEELATGIFTGKLGLTSLPLNEAEQTIIEARFVWLCGDPKDLTDRYMPAKIGHPIYKISQGHGLLRRIPMRRDSPSSARRSQGSSGGNKHSDQRESTRNRQSSSKEPPDTSDRSRYARPRRGKDR